jgi:hypothetical protein
MMIRPIKIFLYFVLIVLLVAILNQALNNAGISMVPELNVLKKTKDTDSVSFSQNIFPEEELSKDDSITQNQNNSMPLGDNLSTPFAFNITTDSLLTAPPGFQKRFILFCKKAAGAISDKKVIRVLHIGDSQIEADRITDILRLHFQDLYQGSGPGFILPYDPLHINATVGIDNTGTWHLEYSYRKGIYPMKILFGFSGKAAWFSGQEGGLIISSLPWKPRHLGQYPNVRLFFTSTDTVSLQIFNNDTLISDSTILPSDSLQVISCNSKKTPGKTKLSFHAVNSPVIHGITLDAGSGVAVDNIPMRGRPWPGIRIANDNMLKQMSRSLNIGMIILQFGTNILPTETNNYNFYRIHFIKELQLLRKLLPNVPVLVIGVQAAAKIVDGELTPMEHARLIAEAQKSAALACDMGFFDLHKAMGGTTGAIEWSEQSPSLMLSDYMHFSSTGAKIVGDRIWQAIDSLRVDLTKTNKPE